MHSMNTAAATAAALASKDFRRAVALRDAWTEARYGHLTERELSESAFMVDGSIIEHMSYCCCDEECSSDEARRTLAALDHEVTRRFLISGREKALRALESGMPVWAIEDGIREDEALGGEEQRILISFARSLAG